jgi:radical SAM superfamily enzyme YgiQ (UPF0313 family)
LVNLKLKKPVDCLFIFSPGSESNGSCFDYNLGSAYIVSYLRSKGFNALQFINRNPLTLKDCVNKILEYRSRIAGFTVYDSNFSVSVLIAEQIRKISPDTLIVFGGPCPSIHYDFIMSRYAFVDACFINESEESFTQFISKLSEENFNYEKSDFTGIIGIVYRSAGKVCTNHENPVSRHNKRIADRLDKYPSPYLSGVIPATEGHNTGIITARGCNQNCVYCNCAILSDRRFSTHSLDRVIGELDFISRHLESTRILTFQDDAFTLIPQRAAKICNAIINNKIRVRLGCITRCDCVDESMLDLMKAAGFVSIAFSLESSNPETLRRIGKVNVAEDIPSHGLQKEIRFIESLERMTAYAKKIGIDKVVASVIVGLPGETIGEARQTIEAIDKNMSIDKYAHNFLSIYKGTPIHGNYKKYGYRIKYINGNPVFPRVTYPVNVIRNVQISPKSHLHTLNEFGDKSTLKILSLIGKESKAKTGFRNIILQSDDMKGKFVRWLKEILSINGTIIQIYSDRESMTLKADRNYEMLIKYQSPSLNVRNYCIERGDKGINLVSSTSILLDSAKTNNGIRIRDFEFVKASLASQGVNFTRTLCKEFNLRDSVSAYSYLKTLSKRKDPFSYLVNQSALPYFANICKWTKEVSNCTSPDTLIVNNKSEVRLCWYGTAIGETGHSYDALINNIKSEQDAIMARRKCIICMVKSTCIKCPWPAPLSALDYCKYRKSSDVSVAAELIIGLDQIKQLFS